MNRSFKIFGGLLAVAGALFVTSCASDKNSPGLEYMPDMYRSAAIEPYVDYGQIKEKENPELKEKLSALVPPVGTIPYYGTDSAEVALMLPYLRKPMNQMKATHGLFGWETSSQDEYTLAASDLINPYTLTAENQDAIFAEGKLLYQINCQHCHGEKGDGKGPMVQSGAFEGVPDYANLKNLSNGQMFYSIYYGKGTMGAHNSLVNKKEIWTLIHYIRKFQDKDYGATTVIPTIEVDENGNPLEEGAEAGNEN